MIPKKLKITILLIMQRLGGSNSNGKNLKIAAKSYLTRQCNFFARRNLDWNGEWKFLFLSVNRNHNNNNKIAIPQIAQCFQFFGCGQSVLLQEKKLAHYPNLLCLTFLVIYLDIARDLFRHINEENQYVTGVYVCVLGCKCR